MIGGVGGIKKFADRLQLLYSDWKAHKGRQWRNAELVVVRTPQSYDGCDTLNDSCRFFQWLFGDYVADSYIVISRSQIYLLCSRDDLWWLWTRGGWVDARLLPSYIDEAKKVAVDLVVKDWGSGRKLADALEKMAEDLRAQALTTSKKTKRRNSAGRCSDSGNGGRRKTVIVGFIGEESPELAEEEAAKGVEWTDVTDAFYILAGIK
ncbi:FACT complex subunit SPT16 [Apostasia shenzhenica]|uniref:FACT complex subunit SPT16 n=1 Tax=Apostasia shenzhenica TaxID=1088818 RepID=A0A2I0AEE7_9ASPA|nr:FACT complex subunit SPT16 [Apostasia shenzhenica]